jgi:hypothetical protein
MRANRVRRLFFIPRSKKRLSTEFAAKMLLLDMQRESGKQKQARGSGISK